MSAEGRWNEIILFRLFGSKNYIYTRELLNVDNIEDKMLPFEDEHYYQEQILHTYIV